MFSKRRRSKNFRGRSLLGLVALLLEMAVLEGFWEAVAFQPGLDGEKLLSC